MVSFRHVHRRHYENVGVEGRRARALDNFMPLVRLNQDNQDAQALLYTDPNNDRVGAGAGLAHTQTVLGRRSYD